MVCLLQDLIQILCGLCLLIANGLNLLINGSPGGLYISLHRGDLIAEFLNRGKQLVSVILFHVDYPFL